MDKEWTELPRFSPEYINGVESFLDFAYNKGRPQGDEILCPCAKCKNILWARRCVVYDHLISKGFLKGYDVWVNHGERISSRMVIDDDMEDEDDTRDDIDGLLFDTF
ncbi:Transposase-associated domain [Sesbania bispinosa]|nr:Transposase-associated domain [Sesbania bispinosa]